MKEFVKAKVGTAVDFWKAYEHRLGVGALAVGFIFDLFVAKRPDSVFDNILLLSYLFIAGSIIILLNLRTRRQMEQEEGAAAPLTLLLILQFCFGGLASNLLVLYGKSGTLTGSAFFIALLVAMVFGNEYLRSRYSQLRFNIVVYYFLMLTYCIIAAPTFIFHSIGAGTFMLSGAISLIVISGYLAILFAVVLRGNRTRHMRNISMYVLIVFTVFNGLYFLNIIPPVPLSLKTIGMYHSVLHYSSGGYLVMYEPPPWYEFWQDTDSTFHYTPGQSAYCFSSVFAPADLTTPIYHHWEHYNSATRQWDTVFRISYPIVGGRSDGYHGYSAIAISAGEWRCNVETSSGALIGRISFTAVASAVSSSTPTLSQTTL
jgi:hypothetical protein